MTVNEDEIRRMNKEIVQRIYDKNSSTIYKGKTETTFEKPKSKFHK